MDLIRDLIKAIQSSIGAETFTDQLAQSVESQLRARYGGRVYRLAERPPEVQIGRLREKARRNEAIRSAVAEGISPAELKERFGLSRQQIYNISRQGW